MKVLLLAPQPFFVQRGTPIAVREALRVLAAEGHRIDVLTYFGGGPVGIEGVRVLRIARPPFVRRVPIGPSWRKALCDAAMLARALRMAGRGGYDIVHAVEEGAFMAWVIRAVHGVPYVYDMDSLMSEQIAAMGPLHRPLARVFGVMERAAVRRSAGVLAVCPALVEIAMRLHPRGKVALLPDMPLQRGADAAPDPEIAAHAGVRFLYVGNLEGYQGIDLMLAAFGAAAPRVPDAVLIVVGGSEPDIARYRAAFAPLCDEGRVRFLGPRPLERLGGVLAAADVLVSPRCAGRNTPMKLYSYLESGRPVLATRLPTHTQVLGEDVACLAAPETGAMAEAMVRLARSAELRARVGANGRRHVREAYDPAAFRRRLVRFYADLDVHPVRKGEPAGLRCPAPAESAAP